VNLLYVSDSNTLSGAEVVLLQHVDHVTARGHAAHVFLRHDNTRLRRALDDRGVAHTPTHAYPEQILRTTANPAAIWHFWQTIRRTAAELSTVMAATRADVVHSVSYPAALHATLAARRRGVPHIWHEHNIKRRHAVNAWLYRFTASACPWVIGPSDAVTHNLARFGIPEARLRTVYNGIDLGRFTRDDERAARVRAEFGLQPDDVAVGLFGQMLPNKGHGTLIDAVVRLRAQGTQVKVLLVGALENPPYQDALRVRIAAEGLDDVVTFTGWRQDVHAVIGAVDIAVVATTTPEPAALSLMETMAMARPIVATATGGTAELVVDGETGLLFAPHDADALARHLARLAANADLRRALGAAGRRRVETRFTEARHLEEIESLYRSALAAD